MPRRPGFSLIEEKTLDQRRVGEGDCAFTGPDLEALVKLTHRQVFWLSDHPTGCPFPPFDNLRAVDRQPSSPITAAGPRRNYTVFPFRPGCFPSHP